MSRFRNILLEFRKIPKVWDAYKPVRELSNGTIILVAKEAPDFELTLYPDNTAKITDNHRGTITTYDKDGQYHSFNGEPAKISAYEKVWYLHGLIHRIDGPAVITTFGRERYAVNGKEISKEEFKRHFG